LESQTEITTKLQHFLISRKILALRLNVSLSTLDRGRKGNVWPYNTYVVIGRRVLYPASILIDLEEMAKSAGSAETGAKS
jgi:hypothetical protein